MKQPKIPQDFFYWTPSEREAWITLHVKPDPNRHEVSVSTREDGEVVVLECICGWEMELRNDETSLRIINRYALSHAKVRKHVDAVRRRRKKAR